MFKAAAALGTIGLILFVVGLVTDANGLMPGIGGLLFLLFGTPCLLYLGWSLLLVMLRQASNAVRKPN